MRAAATPLERVRRRVVRHTAVMASSPLIGPGDRALHEAICRAWGLLTYSVGDYVWARFGATGGLQLARIRFADPVSFDGSPRHWWWVDVFWPTRARWISTHRRVLRALTPTELDALSTSGVFERNGA